MFTVRFIDENALPEGQAWVLGVAEDGHRFLFLKRGAVCSSIFEEAWEAAHHLDAATASMRVAV